ncbi:Hemolin [Eumeta japonica]|uniref:Hemolin n=1 Tax=Eumeta variegata TaxID=151549 RepID=A0A4C1VX00_EUMVA|nr:Hemolin [Eumeta japonica]
MVKNKQTIYQINIYYTIADLEKTYKEILDSVPPHSKDNPKLNILLFKIISSDRHLASTEGGVATRTETGAQLVIYPFGKYIQRTDKGDFYNHAISLPCSMLPQRSTFQSRLNNADRVRKPRLSDDNACVVCQTNMIGTSTPTDSPLQQDFKMAKLICLLFTVLSASSLKAKDISKLPQITSAVPEEVLFKESTPLALKCAASGGPSINYRWTKNGQVFDHKQRSDVDNKEQGTLKFSKPVKSDEGLYECFADNQMGVASTGPIAVKRTYLNAPKVNSHKVKPVRVDPFHMDCPIPDGYPKPTVEWVAQKKDDPKTKETILDRRLTLDPEGTLWFSNFTEQDVRPGYKYVCLASNPSGEEKVPVAEYEVVGLEERKEPRNAELEPQYLSKDMTVLTGPATHIYCIYGGTPLSPPDWFKDGKDTNNDDNPAQQRVTRHNRTWGKRLLIKETKMLDNGEYKCIVDNGIGKKQTHTMHLTVESKPQFVNNQAKEIKSSAGKEVLIPLKVESSPKSTVTWTYNAKPITSDSRHLVTDEGLTIKNLQKTDMGVYGCRAENKHGVVYAETALYVQ